MAVTPSVDAPQGGLIVTYKATAADLNLPQGGALAVYNIPAKDINTTFSSLTAVVDWTAQGMPVTQALITAVVKGRTSNPKLISWWYTLDGHDYYVLKLGTNGKTLVFDLTTSQWSWWANGSEGFWNAAVGMNWRSSGSIPQNYGSNVIVGDDSQGILWCLDPLYGLDDSPYADIPANPFERIATGQIPTEDRIKPPIYQVYLSASLGKPALTANTVTLEYSDDQGNTYRVAGTKTANEGDYEQEFAWRSLGLAGSRKSMGSPGRLFRITDNGAFARIDSLNVT